MTTITLPPEIEGPLAEQARRLGTTPENLALDGLRRLFVAANSSGEQLKADTLFDLLVRDIGSVDGTTEALSERCGQRFAKGLVERERRGRA